jgi:hypothetical protein
VRAAAAARLACWEIREVYYEMREIQEVQEIYEIQEICEI